MTKSICDIVDLFLFLYLFVFHSIGMLFLRKKIKFLLTISLEQLKEIKNLSYIHSHKKWTNFSLAHLLNIRERRKRGRGTLQTRDQNLPK